jgi:predicted DNA-binding protein (MmcQ/YjbR family)
MPPVGGDDEPEHPALARLRSLCTLLPDVTEIDGLGRPTFRVARIAFAVFEIVDGRPAVTVKIPLERQAALVARAGVRADEETGHHGWTVLDVERAGWDEIDVLVVASYRLVAPAEFVARLDALLG